MSQGNFGNLCDTDNFGDPVVLYDSYEDRWVITDFAFKLDASGTSTPARLSVLRRLKTGDPVNGGWNFYSIETPGGCDYPEVRRLADGISCRPTCSLLAGGSYFGYHMWALNKQQMYNGEPSPQVVDFAGDTSDFTVSRQLPLQTGTPPAGSPSTSSRPSSS
jgi:hypothetical protein